MYYLEIWSCSTQGFLVTIEEHQTEETIYSFGKREQNKEVVSYRKCMCFFHVLLHPKLWFRLKASLILFLSHVLVSCMFPGSSMGFLTLCSVECLITHTQHTTADLSAIQVLVPPALSPVLYWMFDP